MLLVELARQEAVAQQDGYLERPVLALTPLPLAQLGCIELLQGEHPVVDVPGFVADDQREELAEERLVGGAAQESEGAQRQALDHDLHAEELHVPAAIGHEGIDHDVEVLIDLVELVELLRQVGVEDLHVPAFVDHLRAPEELGVEPGHRLGDLRGGEQRALLSVEELAQHPGQ